MVQSVSCTCCALVRVSAECCRYLCSVSCLKRQWPLWLNPVPLSLILYTCGVPDDLDSCVVCHAVLIALKHGESLNSHWDLNCLIIGYLNSNLKISLLGGVWNRSGVLSLDSLMMRFLEPLPQFGSLQLWNLVKNSCQSEYIWCTGFSGWGGGVMMMQCPGGGTSCLDRVLGLMASVCHGIGWVGSGGKSSLSSTGTSWCSMICSASSSAGLSSGARLDVTVGFPPIRLRYCEIWYLGGWAGGGWLLWLIWTCWFDPEWSDCQGRVGGLPSLG